MGPKSSSSQPKKPATKRSRKKKVTSSVEASPAPEQAASKTQESQQPQQQGGIGGGIQLPSKYAAADQQLMPPPSQQPGAPGVEEDDVDDDQADFDPEYEKYMREKHEQSIANMKLLLEGLSDEQAARYDTYRSAAFPRQAVKRLMQQVLSQSISDKVAVMVSGVAKLFVGELVEAARDIMQERGQSSDSDNLQQPIQPEHLREAYGRLRLKGSIPTTRFKRKMFLA